MKSFKILALVALLLVSVSTGFAQTNTTAQTTLSTALASSGSQVVIASATGVSASTVNAQKFILIDRELMQVRAISSTTLTVIRAVDGSFGTPHVAGAVVTFGPPGKFDASTGTTTGVFINVDPRGTCAAGSNDYSTVINLATGNSWACSNTAWVETAGPSQALKEIVCRITPGGASIAAVNVDQTCFIATRNYQVVAVSEVHSVAETTASPCLVMLTKDTGTDAPGAGTDLLTNTSSTGFSLRGTANTVVAGTLITTLATLKLAAGDRLSLDFAATGTITQVENATITITLRPF